MSGEMVGRVMRHAKTRTPGSLLVLVAIAEQCRNPATVSWPSIATMGKMTRFTERAVMRHVRTLEATGDISVERAAGRVSRYHVAVLTPDRIDSGADPVTGDEMSTTPLTKRHPSPDRIDRGPLTESTPEPERTGNITGNDPGAVADLPATIAGERDRLVEIVRARAQALIEAESSSMIWALRDLVKRETGLTLNELYLVGTAEQLEAVLARPGDTSRQAS